MDFLNRNGQRESGYPDELNDRGAFSSFGDRIDGADAPNVVRLIVIYTM